MGPQLHHSLIIWHVISDLFRWTRSWTSTSFIPLPICRVCSFTTFPRESIKEQHFNFSAGFRGDCSFLGCTPITTILSRQTWRGPGDAYLPRDRRMCQAWGYSRAPSLHWSNPLSSKTKEHYYVRWTRKELPDWLYAWIYRVYTALLQIIFVKFWEKVYLCWERRVHCAVSKEEKLECCCNIVYRFCLKFDSSNKILKSIGKERKR